MGITWASILGTVLTGFLVWKAFKRGGREKDKLDQIPGSLGLPFIGELISFLAATHSTKGVYHFVNVRRQRYGNWFKTRILGITTVFVPTIEGAKTVYGNDFEKFNKGYVKSMGDLVGKKSLFTVPKTYHQKIRRLLSHPFSMNCVSQFVTKFDKLVSQRLHRLEREGRSFPVLGFTMKVGFDSICDVLLSIMDADLLAEIESDCKAVYDAMITLPVMIPGTLYYRGMKARERLMKRFKSIIDDRRRSGKSAAAAHANDFLQIMLERDSYPDDEKLDDQEIMDNLLTTMLPGQSTTATAMMWAVKFISDHPPVQDKLREEAISILAKSELGATLTYEDVNKMTYTSKVIKETLRMANIVLWFPRVALADCTVDGNAQAVQLHSIRGGGKDVFGNQHGKGDHVSLLHRLTSGYKWRVDNEDPSLECKGFIPKLKSGYPITLTLTLTAPSNQKLNN